jgi:transposase
VVVRRYELSDEAFALVADLLPANGRRGGQWHDHRTILNGIFWILHSGAQWRELPERYGPWPTVYWRYARWRRDGTIDRMLARLQLHLDTDGRIDVELWCIDATQIRASRAAAGARRTAGKKRPRRA